MSWGRDYGSVAYTGEPRHDAWVQRFNLCWYVDCKRSGCSLREFFKSSVEAEAYCQKLRSELCTMGTGERNLEQFLENSL